MASSRRNALLALALSALAGCSVGHGTGEVAGRVHVAGCRSGSYALNPTAFLAQTAEQLLRISIQRGSDIEVRSDGIAVLVENASRVRRESRDVDLMVGPMGDPRVDLTLYLNASCPAERDATPVVLGAVRGTIRFSDIYAPEVDEDDVRIRARFSNVRFEDPRNVDRWAELSGTFDFLYVRGSPAQRFP